ncbi:MAG: HD domain-containing protein [Acidimicrobiia bacterium]
MRAAVIDLGSNSFRMLVASVAGNGHITPVLREREMLHLGAVMAREGSIPSHEADRAVSAARNLANLADRIGVDATFPVATSAIRESSNQDEIVARIETAIGSSVRVLDGLDEARLSYLGAQAAVAVEGPTVVLDLGGGSLEVAAGDGTEMARGWSFPLGVSRLHSLCADWPIVGEAEASCLRSRVSEALRGTTEAPGRAVAIGGPVRAVAEAVVRQAAGWRPPSLNRLDVSRSQVAELTARLTPLTPEQRIERFQVKASRAERLATAGIILETALDALDLDGFLMSDWGLREGVLLDAVGARLPASGRALRASATRALLASLTPGDSHPEHVAGLGRLLGETLAGKLGLDSAGLELVEHALLLHDVGRSVSLQGHHKHSTYLVEHADLRGFSPRELAVLLSLIHCHRGGPPKGSFEPYRSLSPDDQDLTRRLAALVQLADALDRARDGSVESVEATVGEGLVELGLRGADPHYNPEEAADRVGYFEQVFGLRVAVVSR